VPPEWKRYIAINAGYYGRGASSGA
jgi:hypothetical protein